jgi:serine/threonine protein kinase
VTRLKVSLCILPICDNAYDILVFAGLKIMHTHGYVHRDVSTGNILVFEGRGKLSDLEYSKEMQPPPLHEIRTVCFLPDSSNLLGFLPLLR